MPRHAQLTRQSLCAQVAALALCLLSCAAAQSSPVHERVELVVSEGKAGTETISLVLGNVGKGLSADGTVADADGTVGTASMFILVCGMIGILFALFLFWNVSQIALSSQPDDLQPLVSHAASDEELLSIYETIRAGARAFLWAEYQICVMFVAAFGALILLLVSHTNAGGAASWDFQVSIKGLGVMVVVQSQGRILDLGYLFGVSWPFGLVVYRGTVV